MDVNLANVLYDLNELEACSRLVDEAIELTRKWPNPSHLVYVNALKARLLLIQGDLQGARIWISQVDQIRKEALLKVSVVHRTAEAELVRMWLALKAAGVNFVPGDPLAGQASALVASWQSELACPRGSENTIMDECDEIAILSLAQVSLAAGQADQALVLLEPINRFAQAAGHLYAAIASLYSHHARPAVQTGWACSSAYSSGASA